MAAAQTESLSALFEQDETAWLEITAKLVAKKRFAEVDHRHLSEYLTDMAKRDRREVHSRLVLLLWHLLKWEHQSEKRTGSWENTIDQQRLELRLLLESGTLKNHASQILAEAFGVARKRAARETKLKLSQFPKECPWELDELLGED